MSELHEFLTGLSEHFESIPVRAQVNGQFGSFFLHELSDDQAREVVIKWIQDKRKAPT